MAADPNLGEERPDLAIEAVLVHAEEVRRIAQTDEARQDGAARVAEDRLARTGPKGLRL